MLDFAQAQPSLVKHRAAWGWLLFALGLAAALANWQTHRALVEESSMLSSQLAQFAPKPARAVAAPPTPTMVTALETANLGHALFRTPWIAAFTAIESARAGLEPDIALTSLKADGMSRDLLLSGEARSSTKLSQFTQALAEQTTLTDVTLTSTKRSHTASPVTLAFEMRLKWRGVLEGSP